MAVCGRGPAVVGQRQLPRRLPAPRPHLRQGPSAVPLPGWELGDHAEGGYRYLRGWVRTSSPRMTVRSEVKTFYFVSKFKILLSTFNKLFFNTDKLNLKASSRKLWKPQHRNNPIAFRSSQTEDDRGSNSTEPILLCGDEGSEEVGGEAGGGSLVGRHLHQHLQAADVHRQTIVSHATFCLRFITNIK